jgi:hypothetical protein
MSTEVWFRNPSNYIRELVELRVTNIVWDRGMVTKRRIDPHRHAMLYFTAAGITDWRIMLIGDQGTAELGPNNDIDDPIGVYPTWRGDEPLELLEEMMADPQGESEEACDADLPPDEKPVFGQPHRVFVTELPALSTGVGKKLARELRDLQMEYPDCKLHIHGTYSWRLAFGMGFASVDIDPRTDASKGRVTLPTGKMMIAEKTIGCPQWVTLLGMSVVELKEPRNRCLYNIKSALWAAEHFEENLRFQSSGTNQVDPDAKKHLPATVVHHQSDQTIKPKSGDRLQCDTCSLQTTCKYFRTGAVCSVPGSEPAELARYFQTRDSDLIIDGLGTLLAAQTRRLEKGIAEEEMYGELSPEVTKIINQVFTNGTKLAKLVNPALQGGPKVQVNVNGGGAAAVSAATPNQIMGAIVRELEARGVPRDQITPDMVQSMLAEMAGGSPKAEVIESRVLGTD